MQTLHVITFLIQKEFSEEAAEILREITSKEPVIYSKPGLRFDKVSVYLENADHAPEVIAKLQTDFNQPFKTIEKDIEEKDWRDKWKENFKPFMLTKKIRITPSWLANNLKEDKINIILEPGFAFGTGLHETTKFVSKMIEKKRKKCQSFLDLGYGSGILGIVAFKSGYTRIAGIDIEENALITSKENFENNAVTLPFELEKNDLESYNCKDQFDFIAANIISETLINNANKLTSFMHKKSFLCISGITLQNAHEVHKTFKKKNLKCVKKYIGKEWCGFVYKKKKKHSSKAQKVKNYVKKKISKKS